MSGLVAFKCPGRITFHGDLNLSLDPEEFETLAGDSTDLSIICDTITRRLGLGEPRGPVTVEVRTAHFAGAIGPLNVPKPDLPLGDVRVRLDGDPLPYHRGITCELDSLLRHFGWHDTDLWLRVEPRA